MVVHYPVKAFVVVLKAHPILNRTKVVAKMEVARRLNAGEYVFHSSSVPEHCSGATPAQMFQGALNGSNNGNFDVHELGQF